jgi:uncharacterized protein
MTFLVAAAPMSAQAQAPTQAELEAATRAWHEGRLERLKAEAGWLSLVGLDWLEEGENPAGSAQGSRVMLPAGAPARLGAFGRSGAEVRFTPAPKVEVTLEGKPFVGGQVNTDADGRADVLRSGSLQLQVIDRGGRLGVRVRDSMARARTHFRGIERFKVTTGWRKQATFEPAEQGQTIAIPNVLGDISEHPLAGTAVFTHAGKTYRLQATAEGEQLFFVFGDQTNRTDTYGAGRFLYTDLPQDGRVILDFNRAYNPPCAFSAYATCPLPTRQNKLPLRIEAGEKRYTAP